ncbi:MAG: hypothetical protein ABSD56_15730, partial [Bryobacteraceae bacterium]
ASYKFDQGVGAPLRLRAYVFSHKDDPAARKDCEAKLLGFLQTGPAPGGMPPPPARVSSAILTAVVLIAVVLTAAAS